MSKVKFVPDKDLKILRVRYPGMLTKEDVIAHYNEIRSNTGFQRDLRILIDCRDSTFTIKPGEVNELYAVAAQAVVKYDFVKEAVMVSDPYETVIVTLFQQANKIPNYMFQVFNTEQAAVVWLLGS